MEPFEFEARLEDATRIEDVWRQMVGFAGEHGIRRIGYHHIPPPAAPDAAFLRIENEGFGEALLAQYLTARTGGFAVLANLIQNCARAVYLDELEDLVALTPRDRAHIAGYRAAGVVNGLGVQAFGPHARNGIFAIDLGPATPRLAQDDMIALRWACQAMHLRYSTLLLPTLGDVPTLSSREAEVLLWVARGKSNASIGEILGISAHTVDAHLRRIFLKLGVVDRISAALRGLGFGLISLDV
jgi:LuxR family transcriptional regulator/LuxR family quorum-sensing system transcriptional regulator CciR